MYLYFLTKPAGRSKLRFPFWNDFFVFHSSDCIECMACSDNVVRAGLTPKFKDVTTLCNMLDYRPTKAEENKFKYNVKPNDDFVCTYNPPVDEFAVDKIKVCLKYDYLLPYIYVHIASSLLLQVLYRQFIFQSNIFRSFPKLILCLAW